MSLCQPDSLPVTTGQYSQNFFPAHLTVAITAEHLTLSLLYTCGWIGKYLNKSTIKKECNKDGGNNNNTTI